MCTRVLYAKNNAVITGRSMDWNEDMQSDLWIFPRGVSRTGKVSENEATWTSKHGSIIVSSYNIGSADGMNEKGLVANMLYLAESDYASQDSNKEYLQILLWAQYVLDNFASVKETVAFFKLDNINIAAPILPNGRPCQLHLSISDNTGDSAIFEYINGKIEIHHDKQYKVMTNSPTYSEQLAINKYWEAISGVNFIPGTITAADRFVRASYLINSLPKDINVKFINAIYKSSFNNQAILSVLSVIRSISVPLGIETEGKPNLASTIWRTVADSKNLVYLFDSALTPVCAWIDLKNVDFDKLKVSLKLNLSEVEAMSGDCLNLFKEAEPFEVPIFNL